MSDRGIGQLLAFLRRRTAPSPDLVPDGELLHRYTTTRDEAAFELLVRRHGPMVLGVARRVLRETHAAEDVFQAAFLTLARKAKSLRHESALAGWLYRVTLRIAIRAKQSSLSARSIVSGTSSQIAVTVDASAPLEWSELRQILDEEVNKLPERFRKAVVLCYLSGKSTEDAARELGCPRGTILSRLANARERLRRGLTRRGYAIPATVLATSLASETAPAALNSTLVALAMNVIQPAAVVAPAVASLSYGVIHAMLMTKVKIALCLVLVGSAVGVGVGQLGGPGPATAEHNPVAAKTKTLPAVQETEEARKRAEEQRILAEKNEAAEIAQKKIEEHRLMAEKQMIDLLRVTSARRIKTKVMKMDVEDKIDEMRQAMAPHAKLFEQYLEIQSKQIVKLAEMRRATGVKDENAINKQCEQIDDLTKTIESIEKTTQRYRTEIRDLRRQLLEAEEELSLQEKISNIELDRISRSLKQ